MKSKRKDIPKYVAGGLLASQLVPAIAQGAMGIGQAIFGFNQRKQAKDMLENLQRNQPNLQVPTALRRLVNEPIAEEYMQAQESGAQRRTAQAADTLGKLGSRGIGALGNVLESERVGEQQRAGQYEQARRSALGQMAGAEQRIQDMQFNKYMQDVNAARGALEASQQNIMGGFGQVGRGVAESFNPANFLTPEKMKEMLMGAVTPDMLKTIFGGNMGGGQAQQQTAPSTTASTRPVLNIPSTLPDGSEMPQEQGVPLPPMGGRTSQAPSVTTTPRGYQPMPQGGLPQYQPSFPQYYDPSVAQAYGSLPPFGFKQGGVLKTKGVFSHRKNPKDLIDRNTGEVEAELTGNETVFNKEQSEKMERLAMQGKDKELRKYVKGVFKKFKSNRKNG